MFACGGTGYLCPSLLVAGTCSALLVSSSPAVRGKSQARGRSLAVEDRTTSGDHRDVRAAPSTYAARCDVLVICLLSRDPARKRAE
jgi:hypothetical protein